MTRARSVGLILLALAIAFALVPLVRGAVELPTAQHHLLHSLLIAASALAALLLAAPNRSPASGAFGWLLVAMFAPVAAMALMWPSEYTWFELHPGGHAVEHLGLVFLGFLTAYAGQRYCAGVGWAAGLTLFGMALACAWGFGVAPAV